MKDHHHENVNDNDSGMILYESWYREYHRHHSPSVPIQPPPQSQHSHPATTAISQSVPNAPIIQNTSTNIQYVAMLSSLLISDDPSKTMTEKNTVNWHVLQQQQQQQWNVQNDTYECIQHVTVVPSVSGTYSSISNRIVDDLFLKYPNCCQQQQQLPYQKSPPIITTTTTITGDIVPTMNSWDMSGNIHPPNGTNRTNHRYTNQNSHKNNNNNNNNDDDDDLCVIVEPMLQSQSSTRRSKQQQRQRCVSEYNTNENDPYHGNNTTATSSSITINKNHQYSAKTTSSSSSSSLSSSHVRRRHNNINKNHDVDASSIVITKPPPMTTAVAVVNPFQTAREMITTTAPVVVMGDVHDNDDSSTTHEEPQSQWKMDRTRPASNLHAQSHSSTNNNTNIQNPYQQQQPPPPPPPPPIIRESLKRKFQPPKRSTTSGGVESQDSIATTTNGRSKKKPSPVQLSSNNNNNTTGSRTQTADHNKSTMADEDDDELPEELRMYGKELVQKIESEIMDQDHHRNNTNDSTTATNRITFDDIAGLHDQKQTVYEVVCWPMQRPDLFTGLRCAPNGLLLYGPPGTGKTLIGKAIAHESGATFFSISSSSLTSKWIGEGEKLVRVLFAVAAYRQPAVVFIDEIDSLLTQRKSDENEASRRMKTEFLIQLDGTGTSGQGRVLVIGATNRPQELDEAARRRFTKRLYIPLPETSDREALIRVLLKTNHHLLSDNDIGTLAKETEGFSGADLKSLSTDAALGPIRQLGARALEVDIADVPPITYRHFRQALRGMKPSVSPEDLVQYVEWDKIFGTKRAQPNDDSDSDSDDDDALSNNKM